MKSTTRTQIESPVVSYRLVLLCFFVFSCSSFAYSQQEQTAYDRYRSVIEKNKADRKSDEILGTHEVNKGPTVEQQAGDKIQEFTEITYRRTSDLENLVMMDNTIGVVFPGSVLWASAIRDGQLHQLEQISGRPRVTTTFTGLTDVKMQARFLESRNDLVITASRESKDDEQGIRSLSFSHDGSYSGFLDGAQAVFEGRVSQGTRVNADFKISSSVEDAALGLGLSAKYWGGRLESGLEHIKEKQRSVAVMTLSQVFYSATTDAPPLGGYIPPKLLKDNPDIAEILAVRAVAGGEIAYVRRVDYGRRILISLSAEASGESFKAALDTSIKWATGEFSGEISDETKQVWESVEGKLIIIGGKYPPGVNGFFGGDMESFGNAVKAIMSEEYVNSPDGAVPISFELAYVDDNAPMQVFETIEFAGKIPGRKWGKITKRLRISTGGEDTAVTRQDSEIDTDDWTLIQLTSQDLSLSPDRRTVRFDIVWHAFEGEKNKELKKTIIRSAKSFSIPFAKPVREFVSPRHIGARNEWYSGERHTPQQFPNHGLLKNIRVRFDAKGGNDHLVQQLRAELSFTLWLEE